MAEKLKFKQKIYKLIPKRFRRGVKNIYYDKTIYPIYGLKYLIRYGRYDFFNSIAIETTTYCNLRCKFCPNSIYDRGAIERKKLMKLTLFKKIVNELGDIKYNGWILMHFYGEPLTDKRITMLVKYIKINCPNAKVQINSNGFLLTINLYKELLEAGVDRLFITQYGESKIPGVQAVIKYLKTRIVN